MVQCPVHPSSISPASREALRSIYHQVMLSTSYSQHFSPPKPSQCISVPRNGSQWPLSSKDVPAPTLSWLHPPLKEHSGCYQDKMEGEKGVEEDNPVVTEPDGRGHTQWPESMDQPFHDGVEMLGCKGTQVLFAGEETGKLDHPMSSDTPHHVPSTTNEGDDGRTQTETDSNHSCGHGRLDKATQTDQSNWECSLSTEVQRPHGSLQPLPSKCHYITTEHHHDRSLTYPMPGQSPYLVSLCPATKESSSFLTPPYTPRSVLVGQRMGSLLRFSKSEARRRFHTFYPEGAPNLKEHKSHSENERRHVINGHNAYYYH